MTGNINGNSLQREDSFWSKQDCSPEGNVAELVVHGQNLEDRHKSSNMICIISQENIPEETWVHNGTEGTYSNGYLTIWMI